MFGHFTLAKLTPTLINRNIAAAEIFVNKRGFSRMRTTYLQTIDVSMTTTGCPSGGPQVNKFEHVSSVGMFKV